MELRQVFKIPSVIHTELEDRNPSSFNFCKRLRKETEDGIEGNGKRKGIEWR
jgi:hypothetical protein